MTTVPRGKVRLCLNVTQQTSKMLEKAAHNEGVTRTSLVERALVDYLNKLLIKSFLEEENEGG